MGKSKKNTKNTKNTKNKKTIKYIKFNKKRRPSENFTLKKLNYRGGEVIDAGGYGCVFNPALRCNNSKNRTKGISKLLSKHAAEKEWDMLSHIRKYIEKIPNYQKYFLLYNLEKCSPAELTITDKKNFHICDIFEKLNINSTNFNKNLDKFEIINMPYGGPNLETVIFNNQATFATLNPLLIDVLLNAIIPMNRLNIYHKDLKASNILYHNKEVKLIDFGQTFVYESAEKDEYKLLDKPFQFNNPLSIILLSPSFNKFLIYYLVKYPFKKHSPKSLFVQFKKLMLAYYQLVVEPVDSPLVGHSKYLEKIVIPDIYKNLYARKSRQNVNIAQIISDYCANILVKYVNLNTKTFDRSSYVSQVYLKNLDLYGLIMCYLPYVSQYSQTSINVDISQKLKAKIA